MENKVQKQLMTRFISFFIALFIGDFLFLYVVPGFFFFGNIRRISSIVGDVKQIDFIIFLFFIVAVILASKHLAKKIIRKTKEGYSASIIKTPVGLSNFFISILMVFIIGEVFDEKTSGSAIVGASPIYLFFVALFFLNLAFCTVFLIMSYNFAKKRLV